MLRVDFFDCFCIFDLCGCFGFGMTRSHMWERPRLGVSRSLHIYTYIYISSARPVVSVSSSSFSVRPCCRLSRRCRPYSVRPSRHVPSSPSPPSVRPSIPSSVLCPSVSVRPGVVIRRRPSSVRPSGIDNPIEDEALNVFEEAGAEKQM